VNVCADDLELARQCAAGDERAWDRFVLEYRPVLYRAADALAPGGGARDLADALYADLYGMQEREGERRSLFRYFQGRSSLATWLRAVLAQRYIDRVRAERRLVPLPDRDDGGPAAFPFRASASHGRISGRDDGSTPQPQARVVDSPGGSPRAGNSVLPGDRIRYVELMQQALTHAVARLGSRDRLRLGCYYLQELTLADTGRLLDEHEATVSRQLGRTRRAIRTDVERELRQDRGLNDAQIAECFESISNDAGPLDLEPIFGSTGRKKAADDRSV
jgi:RNA polymerase sigma-70 factor (ECF subfamily)